MKAENSDKRDEWLEMLQKESSLSPMAVALRRRRLSTEVFNYTKELVPLTPDAGTPLAGNNRMSSECGLNTISTDSNNISENVSSNHSEIPFHGSSGLTNKINEKIPVKPDSTSEIPKKDEEFIFNLDATTSSTTSSIMTITKNTLSETSTGISDVDSTPSFLPLTSVTGTGGQGGGAHGAVTLTWLS